MRHCANRSASDIEKHIIALEFSRYLRKCTRRGLRNVRNAEWDRHASCFGTWAEARCCIIAGFRKCCTVSLWHDGSLKWAQRIEVQQIRSRFARPRLLKNVYLNYELRDKSLCPHVRHIVKLAGSAKGRALELTLHTSFPPCVTAWDLYCFLAVFSFVFVWWFSAAACNWTDGFLFIIGQQGHVLFLERDFVLFGPGNVKS